MSQARLKAPVANSPPMRQERDLVSLHLTRSAPGSPLAAGRAAACPFLLALTLFFVPSLARAAQPFIWDQDTNGIDDRMETVHLLGWSASFELGDTTLHQRILVLRGGQELIYSVDVIWEHDPSPSEL